MASGKVIYDIIANDRASRALESVSKSADKAGRSVTTAGKSADRAGAGIGKFGKQSGKAGQAFKGSFLGPLANGPAAAAAAGTAIVAFGVQSVNAASDTAESISKMNTVFGESAGEVGKFAKSADAIGLSDRAAADALGTFGNLFTQLKVGAPEAAKMSTEMTTLAADFASFNNADISDVIDAQTAAFRGEYDAVQRFVPTINAAAVEQRALADTSKKSTKELTAQDKALAVQKLLMEGAGAAAGDFARTSEGLANKQRVLRAKFEDVQAQIGAKLIPIVLAGITAFERMAGRVADAGRAIGNIAGPIVNFGKKIGGGDKAGKAFSLTLQALPGPLGTIGGLFASTGTKATTFTAAQAAATQAVRDAGGEFDNLGRQLAESDLSSRQMAAAEKIRGAATSGATASAKLAAAALDKQRIATEKLFDATVSAFNSELSLLNAQDSLDDSTREVRSAQSALATAIAEHGAKSAEAREATESLSDAQRDQRGSALSAAEAARAYATDTSKAKTESGKAAAGSAAYRAELVRQQNKYPALRAQIQTYIDKLDKTKGERKATVRAETSEATRRVLAIERQLSGIPDETVNVNVRTNYSSSGRGGRNRAAEGRASGGPVKRGTPYIVGERRPELFVPSSNGRIVPKVPESRSADIDYDRLGRVLARELARQPIRATVDGPSTARYVDQWQGRR